MKKLLTIHLLWLTILGFVSCRGDEPKRMPDTLPDINGTITKLTQTKTSKNNIRLQLMVEANKAAASTLQKASISVDDDTLIEDEKGKRLKAGQLQQGQRVEVWFRDAVMESMPVQATAAAIRLSNIP